MKRLSIFVHHDKYNIIDDYVVYWLKTMNKLSDIIFVSNNDLQEQQIDKIKAFTIKNIVGNHGGVGARSISIAFSYAYDNKILQNYDWLFLIVDSFYGPFFDIEPFIKNKERKNNIAYSFTIVLPNTDDVRMQAPIIAIPKTIFLSNEFCELLSEWYNVRDKYTQIIKTEARLSQIIKDKGYKLEGFFDDIDPTLEIYNRYEAVKSTFIEMIKNGYPFIIRNLFTKNYLYIENINEYLSLYNIIPKECFDNMQKNIDRVIDKEDLKINIYYPHIRKYLDYKKSIIEERYLTKYGLRIELFEVETFIEKLNWLKLYYNTKLIVKVMDKYSVRNYITEKIGDKYLIPLLGKYNNFYDIFFNLELNKLNDKVIFYSTINEKYVLFDKLIKKEDYNMVKYKIADLINPSNNKYFENFEWGYKYIKPRILVYKYYDDIHNNKLKYKVLCFKGEPKIIKVIYFEDGNYYSNFYDLEWNLFDLKQSCPNIQKIIEKPKYFCEMLDISKKLSVDFYHFVAIELIETQSQIYFSKFDFYSDDITLPLSNQIYDFEFGRYIELPQKSCEFFSLEQDTISMVFTQYEPLIIEGIKRYDSKLIDQLKLNSNWLTIFGISNNSEYLRLTLFGIKFTFRINEDIINKLAWWIPVRKWRDNFRNKFNI